MVSLGDVVLINDLCSEKGRKLNTCFGKVTASVNHVGRVGVTPFSKPHTEPFSKTNIDSIPFDESNAVRLKLGNVTVLSKNIIHHYMGLLRNSLCEALNDVSRSKYYFVPSRRVVQHDIGYMVGDGRGTPDLPGTFISPFDSSISRKVESANTMRDNNPEGALKIYAELLSEKVQGKIMSDSYLVNEWFEFDRRVDVASCLGILNCPHQALDVMEKAIVPWDQESMVSLQNVCYNLQTALSWDKRGEVAYKMLLNMNKRVLVNNPGVFHEFGSYYARFGKDELARVQFEEAAKCLEQMPDNPVNQKMKDLVDLELQLLDSIEQGVPAVNARPWKCNRSAEKKFDIGL